MYLANTEIISLEGTEIRILNITNTDELYDRLIQKGDDHEDVRDERIPYWADLWPSAIGLAMHLQQPGVISRGIQVHEMGCGLGLPGIMAGILGAQVTFSDYLDEALQFASQNWKLNCREDAAFVKMDWRHPDPNQKADLLLASDVAYERKAFDYLPSAFKALTNEAGKILVSEPNRLYAQPFFESLEFHGFKTEKFVYTVDRNKMSHRINVFEITQQR